MNRYVEICSECGRILQGSIFDMWCFTREKTSFGLARYRDYELAFTTCDSCRKLVAYDVRRFDKSEEHGRAK